MKLYMYLNYGGNCQEAFRFYERNLGGKITMMMTHGEGPNANTKSNPANWENAILHARMTIGETELMGADIPSYQPMRSAYLTLIAGSTEEAERLYATLTDGGEIFMPIAETFFAFRFAMLRDRFGTSWMILHERPMP